MNDMVRTYLHLPPDYRMCPTPLCWSVDGDAIEGESGGTFAFTHEIALFLQGFINQRRLIHFAYVVHLFRLLGLGRNFIDEPGQAIRQLFQQAGGSLPNAGAFAAQLCGCAPAVAHVFDLDGTSRRWMTNTALLSFVSRATAVNPPLGEVPEALPCQAEVFEQRVRKSLAEYTHEQIRHWFRHGTGPVAKAGEELARELEVVKPRTLAGVLAALAQRERLAGAVPLVAQMVSALALPPRRLDRNEMPLGGYADVTTRGQPEHLLPSQFAIDDLEFVRRFASRELLYFRREEPNAQLREELVLLLDQGARTWGEVRLILSAAVFALAKRAIRRGVPIKIAGTSSGGELVDPLQGDDDKVGTLVEASDLSLHPGEALEQVLLEPAVEARDVVLLTHPRSLTEPDVAAAAMRVPRGTRLFAVTVDDQARAQLVEIRRGTAVCLTQFRVDRPRPAPTEPVRATGPHTAWTGNVEGVGFPFRFGITTPVHKFAFDRAGDWLLVASGNGILHAHATDGSCTEVLPRGAFHHDVLTYVDAILGLNGGFVVGGRLEMELVAMHYHWPERRVIRHILGAADDKRWQWYYLPQFHCVVVRSETVCYGVDLATGERGANLGTTHRPGSRVEHACSHVWHYRTPPPELPFSSEATGAHERGIVPVPQGTMVDAEDAAAVPAVPPAFGRRTAVHLEADTGTLSVTTFPEPSGPDDSPTCEIDRFTPQADGRPALQGCRILSAQHSGNVLAISTYLPSQPQPVTLRLFRLPEGVPICEYLQQRSTDAFTLSGDGRWLARQVTDMQVAVHDLASGSAPVSLTPLGRCHQNLTAEVCEQGIIARIGDHVHLIRWDAGPLVIRAFAMGREEALKRHLAERGLRLPRPPGRREEFPGAWWSSVWYDRKRFVHSAKGDVVLTIDVFGQIAVWSRSQELLCMFFIFRDKVAAWMPDGTRHGPPSITGGPATPAALEKIAEVLRQASARPGGGPT